MQLSTLFHNAVIIQARGKRVLLCLRQNYEASNVFLQENFLDIETIQQEYSVCVSH